MSSTLKISYYLINEEVFLFLIVRDLFIDLSVFKVCLMFTGFIRIKSSFMKRIEKLNLLSFLKTVLMLFLFFPMDHFMHSFLISTLFFAILILKITIFMKILILSVFIILLKLLAIFRFFGWRLSYF